MGQIWSKLPWAGLEQGPFSKRELGEKDLEKEVDEDLEEDLARLAHIPLIRPPLGPAESHGPHTSSSSTSSSSTSSSPTCSSFFFIETLILILTTNVLTTTSALLQSV